MKKYTKREFDFGQLSAINAMKNSVVSAGAGSGKTTVLAERFTKLVKDACDLMGIVLLDHLIVSHSSYFSYREKTDLI